MRTIGIRELKARLSQVLREVQRGEPVLVTDRGRVVAELRVPDATTWARGTTPSGLARLAADSHLRLAEPRPDAYRRSPLASEAGTAARLLDAERADR